MHWMRSVIAIALAVSLQARDTGKSSWANVENLRPGSKLTVIQSDEHREKGRFRQASEQAITIRTKRGNVEIARAQVVKITSPSKQRRLRNAGIGAGAGAGIGALVAYNTASGDHRFAAFMTALFTVGLCGIFGAAMPASHTIYER
jgi:hypothetical protein